MHFNPLECPVCFRELKPAGATRAFGRQSNVPVLYCSCCDVYCAQLIEGAHASDGYDASYTRPSMERSWRKQRDGFNRYILRLIGQRLPYGISAPVLVDFGCCYGHLLSLAEQRGFRAIGVEVNRALVKLLSKRGVHVESSMANVPAGVDVVTFIDSFYYVAEPLLLLEETREKLRADGLIMLRITNRNWIAKLRRMLGNEDLTLLGDTLFSYSLQAMRKLLESAGFAVVAVIPDHGTGKSLSWWKKLAFTIMEILTVVTAHRLNLSSGLIIVATCL